VSEKAKELAARYGEDANRLALLLDKAEPGSALEHDIIVAFMARLVAGERLAEARWWHNFAFIHPWTGEHVKDAHGRDCCKRLEALESQAGER